VNGGSGGRAELAVWLSGSMVGVFRLYPRNPWRWQALPTPTCSLFDDWRQIEGEIQAKLFTIQATLNNPLGPNRQKVWHHQEEYIGTSSWPRVSDLE
jgi:hypothetical protein